MERAGFRYTDPNEPLPVKRSVLRLRKRNLPVYEKLGDREFESWFQEELLKRQRTGEITGDLIGGIIRAIRPVVFLVAKHWKQICNFDDLLHDTAIRMGERESNTWNPLRSSAVSYLRFTAFDFAKKQVPLYKSEYFSELGPWLMAPSTLESENFLLEDFIQKLPEIKWRFNPAICEFIALHLLSGQRRKDLIKFCRRTFFNRYDVPGFIPHKEATKHCNYVAVTLRIELSNMMGRYEVDRGSGEWLSRNIDSRVFESLWDGEDETVD